MLEGSASRIFDGLQAIGVRGEFDLAPFSLLIVEPAVVQTKFPWAPISIGGTPDQIAENFGQFRMAGLEYAICLFESENVEIAAASIRSQLDEKR